MSTSSFSDLPLHPLLAEAIAKKGYTDATPVQAAVVSAKAGADLLVSSHTGSGKTLAFGLLIGERLLGQRPQAERPAAEAPKPRGPRPVRALVVVPTRELAAQVGRELGWLFGKTRLRLATFTGGTSVARDLHNLHGALDIAVGTPGRLVDLHERKALVLSGVEVLVLDEADEMLDLGFQADLEFLLGQAPKERRTLLFSATIPSAIARLAARYQREAVRIDTNPGGKPRAHEDIRFVGHFIRPEDRLGTVVNSLLCLGEGSKAIVFCRTRERVGELHQILTRLGLRASAIAGDRAQAERDRALLALRRGDVHVMVATDVAARGLDLPDVDLVVHADLPDSGEALTHRSGRTGRAGRKGTSVVIAELRERRKAERLLQDAGATCEFLPAPDAEAVARHMDERLVGGLLSAATGLAQAQGEGEDAANSLLRRLRVTLPDPVLLRVLLAREQARLTAGIAITPLSPPTPAAARDRRAPPAGALHDKRGPKPHADRAPAADAPDGPRAERPTRPDFEDAIVFSVNLGHEMRAEPRWLLPTLCRRGQVTRDEIGAIRIGKRMSVFEISRQAAQHFEARASRPDPRSPEVAITRLGPGRADDFRDRLARKAAPPEHARPKAHARPGGPPKRRGPPRGR